MYEKSAPLLQWNIIIINIKIELCLSVCNLTFAVGVIRVFLSLHNKKIETNEFYQHAKISFKERRRYNIILQYRRRSFDLDITTSEYVIVALT